MAVTSQCYIILTRRRITDHRSGESVYGIQGVMEGGNLWEEFWEGLRELRRKEVEEMMEEDRDEED